ncbi:UBX domain-containing protein 11 [Acropora cervicornis]|uniref:UBX domain-containing protein 11 n=1 Tax=Acropora cervicornis TaxID=6130 RepID=A0AAD9UUB9_ACRCE|nr:UBX domain-containing protein 11 [Acropora cervicornis]
MSSPISSLKKGKRNPLDPRQVQVPFRNPNHSPDDFKRDSLLKLPKSSSSTNVPSDHDLLGSMMTRLTQAEQQLKASQTKLVEKDKKIHILEEKAKLLEKARGYNSDTITELERKCRRLQTQVFQMEEFLADYGMIWVGDDHAESDEDTPRQFPEGRRSHQGVWKPDSSLVSDSRTEFAMDFDCVLNNIRELNILAGEGCSDITRTKDGARLKQCMQDIMDGFFPSELQIRYPDGVPLEVQDKRDVMFEDKRTAVLFPGTGQSLIGDEDSSKTLKVETKPPGQRQQSVDQFLSRLPQSVIKEGKIIDVRSGVANVIKGVSGHSDIKVLETPVLQDIKSRSSDSSRPQSGKTQVTTLRIKSETGEVTYILKMKFTDTVGDVRRHIDAERSSDALPYAIKTSFPNQVYDNPSLTLQECGLVPNATLHLLSKKS